MKICVIGAGVVGLNTSLALKKEYPNSDVTILADKFTTETTSDVAAGLFRPGTSFSGPTDEITRTWINDSYWYWDDLRKSSIGSLAGVTQISSYIFSSSSPNIVRNRYLEKLLPLYRVATPEELKICPGDWKYGSFYTTLLAECRIYQPWASKKFTELGGKIISQHIENFNELTGKYDVVVNCSGLGAKLLCSDHKLVPIRGQIIKVKAPWLKTAFYDDYDTYIIPGFNGIVTLGGTRQYDSYNLNLDKYDSISIRERCEQLVPSLVNAPVEREAVGLRPHRDTVRVEIELINTEKGVLKVIHNYGHGGYGVTTSPGTAQNVVKLMKDVHSFSGSKL